MTMTDINRQLGARRAAYNLLARLYLAPPDADLAQSLGELPGFAEHVPATARLAAWLDDLAIEHERLFGMNVYPYESIYRDRELMLNTASADRAAALYQACGFDAAGSPSGAPDHLGLELGLMSELVAQEQQAHAHGDWRAARRVQSFQARCLGQHLAHWAPICAHTVARLTTQPLYAALAILTTELVLADLAAAHARHIPLADRPAQHASAPPYDEAAAESPLRFGEEDDERGVGVIVRQLLTPDRVGVLLCRADISAIGRALGLPAPLVDRMHMLRGLFEAAGQFDHIPALLDALDQPFAQADTAVSALMLQYPAWASYGAGWRERIARGRALLAELRAQASEYG
jgi:TorA maturation chaperone TorD